MTGLPEVSLFEASLGGVSLCLWLLRLLRCGRGVSCGCAIALRNALKKSRKGPALATLAELIRMAIDKEPTIARSDRFTRTISYQPFGVRASGSADSLVAEAR